MLSTGLFYHSLISVLCFLFLAQPAFAHQGHRFVVHVENNKLVAQGVNTESPIRFNELPVRPYRNVIHDHWTNYAFNGVDTAISDLPGFDVPATEQKLWYSELNLKVNKVYRWDKPPESPSATTTPVFISPISEEFRMILKYDVISSEVGLPDSMQLVKYIAKTGAPDIDLRYELKKRVTDSIYVIEASLSTTAEGIDDSDTVYIILGPPGYRYQKALIFLEQYLSKNESEIIYQAPAEKFSLLAFVRANLILILGVLSLVLIVAFMQVRANNTKAKD